jgi:protein-S-isoprenylcysteine O-methyltransferase Ste14
MTGTFVPVLSVLWLAWLLSWGLAAGWTDRTVAQQTPRSRLVQSLFIWLGAFFCLKSFRGVFGEQILALPSWLGWLAVVTTSAGFAMTWWARLHLGRNWSAAVTLKAEHTLVRSGPYAITRHPIYSGLLVAVLSTALVRDSLAGLIGFGLILLGLALKLREEEAFLHGRFGPAYDVYKRDVAGLIPGLW